MEGQGKSRIEHNGSWEDGTHDDVGCVSQENLHGNVRWVDGLIDTGHLVALGRNEMRTGGRVGEA